MSQPGYAHSHAIAPDSLFTSLSWAEIRHTLSYPAGLYLHTWHSVNLPRSPVHTMPKGISTLLSSAILLPLSLLQTDSHLCEISSQPGNYTNTPKFIESKHLSYAIIKHFDRHIDLSITSGSPSPPATHRHFGYLTREASVRWTR